MKMKDLFLKLLHEGFLTLTEAYTVYQEFLKEHPLEDGSPRSDLDPVPDELMFLMNRKTRWSQA